MTESLYVAQGTLTPFYNAAPSYPLKSIVRRPFFQHVAKASVLVMYSLQNASTGDAYYFLDQESLI